MGCQIFLNQKMGLFWHCHYLTACRIAQYLFNLNNDKKADKEIEKNFPDKLDDDLIHMVKRNETVFKISRIYNISVQSIVENNLRPISKYEDQRLKIPIYDSPPKRKNYQR